MNKSSNRKKSNRKMYIITLLIVTVGLALFFLINQETKKETAMQTDVLEIPFIKQGELIFIDRTATDALAIIGIEVADDDQKRARGLMYRKSIPENGGMLFTHETEQIQSFWMKNTYIPLDIIFVNKERKIVTIHPNTRPMKEWSYASTEPAIYVVEVNAGFCARNNIRTGDKIDFKIKK